MRMVFLGPPGVGKGTQSQRLTAHFGIPHLSTGEMLRRACHNKTDLGQQADEYMAQGKLVPDSLMLQLVERRMAEPDSKRGYLLDGFPRTLGQAEAFDAMLRKTGDALALVVELKANPEVLVSRMAGRGREDDRPEIVRRRLEEYFQQTAPLSEYYRKRGILVTIDGSGTPDEVFDRITEVIERVAHKSADKHIIDPTGKTGQPG